MFPRNKALLFDGAMGTMLQRSGLGAGELPERYNLTHPDVVTAIHRAYVEAGADVITTNTFGASRLKLGDLPVAEAVHAAVACAQAAGAPLIALDIGPLGQLMAPMGTLSFEEAYDLFREQVIAGVEAGADLILIETISDLLEAKAAVLAAKENSGLPVLCTMTYQADGRTFMGCDPVTATLTLQSLGVAALGINCSLGPAEIQPMLDAVLRYARIPVMVQANAGLPSLDGDDAVYTITADDFAREAEIMLTKGIAIVGGCCGTDPDYIRALRRVVDTHGAPTPPVVKPVTAACSGTSTVLFDGVTVIGERINPTGKKRMKEALRTGALHVLVGEAIDQQEAGADLLDVNVGLPEIDEPAMMRRAVAEIQGVVPLPLQIDSSDPAAIEAGVRRYSGRPLINSVNGKAESMAAIFPIAKKYGALVVGLTLDETGIPETAEGRLAIARRIRDTARTYGIPDADILIDTLVLTASAQQAQVIETLRTIGLVKRELGLKTVLGVSNVSFGLPRREVINATFLAAAFGAGLDAPILNPMSKRYMETVDAFRVLANQDPDAAHFIAAHSEAPKAETQAATDVARDLRTIILQGRKDEAAPATRELLRTMAPLDIVDAYFIPALDEVGARYESGRLFLPQLMQSAETVHSAFEAVKAHMEKLGDTGPARGKILLATVKGDIHDIGKNIVRMLLQNYGYAIIDLGKDVPIETVVETARRESVDLIGLSALMTTTVKSMKDTITALREAGMITPVVVGGAVLSEDYAALVGADYYAKDAMATVTIAGRVMGH